MDAGKHAAVLPRLALIKNTRDPILSVDFDGAPARRIAGLAQHHGGDGAALLMHRQ